MTVATKQETMANRVVLAVDPPSRILVVPWGEVATSSGKFIVDAESASALVQAFEDHAVDLPIDLEHQTLGGGYSSPSGAAPAVGWIKALAVESGVGIWATTEWTQEGAEYVSEKQYRYLSPVVLVRKEDQRAVVLHSVGLTNKPAIVGMAPIVNKDRMVTNMEEKLERALWFLNLETTATEQEIVMKMEEFLTQLRELAGGESATQADVLSALKQKIGDAKAAGELRAAVCKAASVDKSSKDEELVAAVNKLAAPPKDGPAAAGVPQKEYDVLAASHRELTDKVGELETRANKASAETRIKEAQAAGLLSEHMLKPGDDSKNYYLALAERPEEWEQWKARAPQLVPKAGQLVSNRNRAVAGEPPASSDAIVANSDKFAPERMEDYERIAKHAAANKCSFQEAMEACGAL